MNREQAKELIRCTFVSPFNKEQFKASQETNPKNPKLIRTRAKKYPNDPKMTQKLTKMTHNCLINEMFIQTYRTDFGHLSDRKGTMGQKWGK